MGLMHLIFDLGLSFRWVSKGRSRVKGISAAAPRKNELQKLLLQRSVCNVSRMSTPSVCPNKYSSSFSPLFGFFRFSIRQCRKSKDVAVENDLRDRCNL